MTIVEQKFLVSPKGKIRQNQVNRLPQTGYTCTHAVTSLQLQNTLAGHPRMQSDQAQLRGPSATILAAKVLDIKLLVPLFT